MAQAFWVQNDLDSAKENFAEVIKLAPNDKDLWREYKELCDIKYREGADVERGDERALPKEQACTD